MAVYNKFDKFCEDLAKKVHDLHADTLKTYLTNTAPLATNSVKADIAEITAANGYVAGGIDIQNTVSRTGATTSVNTVDPVFTAAGGSVGPLRYAVVDNDIPAAKPLIGWHDYGSSITLLDGESLTVDYAANKLLDIA